MPESTPFDESRTPWRAWAPEQASQRLRDVRAASGVPIRWAVAGGWAVDLFLGRVTREHEDLEIVVMNDDVPAVLAAFAGPEWRWDVPAEGWLHPLPSPAFDETHQTWLWSESDGAFVLDVVRDGHDGDEWICRLDPWLRRPWSATAEHTAQGVPFLSPEIVLLFKAEHRRPKDVADLAAALPSLDEQRRTWLRDALDRVHPGHEWREQL